jgi:hypothetical protein
MERSIQVREVSGGMRMDGGWTMVEQCGGARKGGERTGRRSAKMNVKMGPDGGMMGGGGEDAIAQ